MTIFSDDVPVAAMKRGLAAPGQFSTTWPTLADQEVADILAALLRSAEDEIDLVRRQTVQRILPSIGDLTAIRLLGTLAGNFYTTEVPYGGFVQYDNQGLY
jgi:hypothetical protein